MMLILLGRGTQLAHFLKGFQMLLEGLASLGSSSIASIGLSTNKSLLYSDIFIILKGTGMASQVAICNTQKFFKGIKVGTFINHQYGHDCQAYAMVKRLIDMCQKRLQNQIIGIQVIKPARGLLILFLFGFYIEILIT